MEDFDNAKTRNPKECVVTNLNSYLTYISDIKETIKKEEGAEVSTKHLLKKYKYPPEDYDAAISTVISQCEMWTDNMTI